MLSVLLVRVLVLSRERSSHFLLLPTRSVSMAFLRRLVKGSDKKDPAAAMEDNTTTASDPLQDVTSKTADLSLAPGDGVEEFSVATFALS